VPHKDACLLSDEQARQTLGFCLPELLFHNREFSESVSLEIIMYLCPQITKTKQDMEVVSIERSTYEELLTSFNSFVAQMRALADRGTDKKLGDWLDNQDVCQMLNISPRTLQTLRDNGTLAYSQINRKVYYKPEDIKGILHVVTDREKDRKMHNLKTSCL
jgi:hypothetical protein